MLACRELVLLTQQIYRTPQNALLSECQTAQNAVKVMTQIHGFHVWTELLTCCCTGMDITADLVTVWTSYDHDLPLNPRMNSSIRPFKDNRGF